MHIDNRKTSSMRAGWTMIELIFILIVIGILSTIAISKLAATRDDAKLSADVSNMGICLHDIGSVYTVTQVIDINTTSCNNIHCYTIDVNGSAVKVDINQSAIAAFSFCADIENVGGHLVKTYQFAGQTVTR